MTKTEIQENIEALDAVINDSSMPKTARDKASKQKADLTKQLSSMQDDVKPSAAPYIPTQGMDAVTEALSVIRTLAMSGGEGGVNSDQVNKIIETYLSGKKINIRQLDETVLEEIKKNQTVVISVPSLDLEVQLSKADSEIPNVFTIIDDVLAGNNVYLIGAAGAGKTYTAERVAAILKRELLMINCSQYTSPTEIVGGQTIEGYKEGKLIRAWKDGKILILDEMPRLDPNTAGLFNDALSKSSHTRSAISSRINSANPEEPPFERNNNFGLIATGNVYPNTPPAQQYLANNQQDLSLLDRFSGSVYETEYDRRTDEITVRYEFLYKMLEGNYYEWMTAKKANQTTPNATGLRTVIQELGHSDKAVVSYRTNISFRVAFETQLVRAIQKRDNPDMPLVDGKTLLKAWNSFLVAFSPDVKRAIIAATGFTDAYIEREVNKTIDTFLKSTKENNLWLDTLIPSVREVASKVLKDTQEIKLADKVFIQ